MTPLVNISPQPLDSLLMGTKCRIVSLNEESDSLVRLMEMGLIPGATLTIERIAPLGSPFSLKLAGFTLAVRRDDMKDIFVELLNEN